MVLNNGIFKRIVKVGALCEGDIRRFIPYKRLECVALLLCGFPDRATATVGPPLYRGIFLDQKCANHKAIPIWPIQSNSLMLKNWNDASLLAFFGPKIVQCNAGCHLFPEAGIIVTSGCPHINPFLRIVVYCNCCCSVVPVDQGDARVARRCYFDRTSTTTIRRQVNGVLYFCINSSSLETIRES